MICITGDTYDDFKRVHEFCRRFETSEDDILIILGNASSFWAETIHLITGTPRRSNGKEKGIASVLTSCLTGIFLLNLPPNCAIIVLSQRTGGVPIETKTTYTFYIISARPVSVRSTHRLCKQLVQRFKRKLRSRIFCRLITYLVRPKGCG